MSIIQDALRRKEQEVAARPAAPAPPPAPPPRSAATPPPPPRPDVRAAPGPEYFAFAPAPARVRAKRQGRWILPVVLTLLLMGSAGAAVWYVIMIRGADPSPAGSLDQNSLAMDEGVPAPQTPVKKVAADWPTIRLHSLARASGGRGSAILNGKLLLVGDDVEGATLVEVGEEGVTLELEGERVFLRIGNETR